MTERRGDEPLSRLGKCAKGQAPDPPASAAAAAILISASHAAHVHSNNMQIEMKRE